MAAHEKALISAALTAHSGSLKATYEALGLSRKALYEKMQKHGLDRSDYRADVSPSRDRKTPVFRLGNLQFSRQKNRFFCNSGREWVGWEHPRTDLGRIDTSEP
jgi:hypothetical protein